MADVPTMSLEGSLARVRCDDAHIAMTAMSAPTNSRLA
jgi:hypothetical protein